MPKLTDTQLVVLSAASQRDSRLVLPLPKTLRGGAARKSIESMIAKGLVEERDANVVRGDPIWRRNGDGHGLTLAITDTGLAALDGDTLPTEAGSGRQGRKADKPKEAAQLGRKESRGATVGIADRELAVRDGTKQARLIAMLKRPKGATIIELAEALGWQAHTVRGALAGALKKRLGLAVTSDSDKKRGRVYRIA